MLSNVSDYLELAVRIFRDAAARCPAKVSVVRDLKYLKSRVKEEGLSFLTITLPSFCRDLEQALQNGGIDSSTPFRGFHRVWGGSIPAFLQGMTSHLFDRETGRIYDEIPPIFVESIRQCCLSFKKLELDCTPERDRAVLKNFVEVERSLCEFSSTWTEDTSRTFCEVSDVLWGDVLADFKSADLIPRHGPGATAERISGNQKYVWQQWYGRLESLFPFVGTAYCSIIDETDEEFQEVSIVETEHEAPVRVTLVPKTLKASRAIAIEPVCMQFVQQGIRDFLYKELESNWLTRGHVNFTDQSINQRLAIASSRDGRLATIDLSDASDRVPLLLVKRMLRRAPELLEAILACRSTRAILPNQQVIPELAKFASMGSALCFPIEAVFFYTTCVAALLEKRNLPVTIRNIFMVSRNVYIYGDDCLVDTDDADAVIGYLQRNNCKVNTSKTFTKGNFRESCGVDAYSGVQVTPTYIRKERPMSRRNVSEILSWVATANQFASRGYDRVAHHMFKTCEQLLGPLPTVPRDSPALGRISTYGYDLSSGDTRWNVHSQAREILAWVPYPVYRSDRIDGYSALHKCLLKLEGHMYVPELAPEQYMKSIRELVKADPLHLERTVRRGAVTLKRRWVLTHIG